MLYSNVSEGEGVILTSGSHEVGGNKSNINIVHNMCVGVGYIIMTL